MTARLDFWARRKAAVEAEESALLQAEEAQALAEEHAALEDKPDAEILAELNLPDPETLQPGDDIKGFMAQAVPDRLRRRALRQLWKLNPVLANVDGLVEYGEDFTDSATVVENLQTAYQVGKGMLAHVEEMARQAAAAEEEEAAPPEAEDMDVAQDSEDAAPIAASDEGETVVAEADPPIEPDEPLMPAPRRMRFEFEGTA